MQCGLHSRTEDKEGNIMRSRSFLANWRKLPVFVAAVLMAVMIAITMERRTGRGSGRAGTDGRRKED